MSAETTSKLQRTCELVTDFNGRIQNHIQRQYDEAVVVREYALKALSSDKVDLALEGVQTQTERLTKALQNIKQLGPTLEYFKSGELMPVGWAREFRNQLFKLLLEQGAYKDSTGVMVNLMHRYDVERRSEVTRVLDSLLNSLDDACAKLK